MPELAQSSERQFRRHGADQGSRQEDSLRAAVRALPAFRTLPGKPGTHDVPARRSPRRGVRWRGDIDLRTNRVSITRGVVRADGKSVLGSPKSDAGVRDVAIPPHLIPVVKAHLKNHTGTGKDALLFPAAADSNPHMAPSTIAPEVVRWPRSNSRRRFLRDIGNARWGRNIVSPWTRSRRGLPCPSTSR